MDWFLLQNVTMFLPHIYQYIHTSSHKRKIQWGTVTDKTLQICQRGAFSNILKAPLKRFGITYLIPSIRDNHRRSGRALTFDTLTIHDRVFCIFCFFKNLFNHKLHPWPTSASWPTGIFYWLTRINSVPFNSYLLSICVHF